MDCPGRAGRSTAGLARDWAPAEAPRKDPWGFRVSTGRVARRWFWTAGRAGSLGPDAGKGASVAGPPLGVSSRRSRSPFKRPSGVGGRARKVGSPRLPPPFAFEARGIKCGVSLLRATEPGAGGLVQFWISSSQWGHFCVSRSSPGLEHSLLVASIDLLPWAPRNFLA